MTDKYAFIYSSKEPHNSLLHYVSECKQLAMKNKVSIVLAAHDIADLIGAALVLELSHFYGPSVESYFLAHHKYYSRKHLDLFHMFMFLLMQQNGALEHVGVPSFIKPSSTCT